MSIFPENISSYGAEVDSLGLLITILVGIGFFISLGLLFYMIFRFRHRPGAKAAYIDGTRWAHLKWVLVPTIVILGLDLFIDAETHGVWAKIKEYLPTPDVTVRVTGQQFSWLFTYPDADGNFDSPQALRSTNEFHVPIDANVVFNLEAKDVIHSFWVPSLRLKQDAVPGRVVRAWFKATKLGTFDIGCAQICGSGHGLMRAHLVVQTPEEYKKWRESAGAQVQIQQASNTEAAPAENADPRANKGAQLVQSKTCTACHSTDGAKVVGPSYKGLFGKLETVITNGIEHTVTVDEEYLRKSMIEPGADVVKGFDNIMPPQRAMLTDEEIDDIIAFIKSLK